MSQDNKSKFMPNEEEIEKQRKEILVEMNKSNNEIRKEKNKKILIITLIISIVIILIKSFWGTIELYNIFGYPSSKVRYYNVTINGKPNSVEYVLTHRVPIVPFLVNFNSKYIGSNFIRGDEDGITYKPDDSERFIIDIESYNCYSKNYQVECKSNTQEMKKNNDTKYTNLQIVRINNPYEELYNGEFVNDITDYVKSKGVYYVGITAEYSLVETQVCFYFERK